MGQRYWWSVSWRLQATAKLPRNDHHTEVGYLWWKKDEREWVQSSIHSWTATDGRDRRTLSLVFTWAQEILMGKANDSCHQKQESNENKKFTQRSLHLSFLFKGLAHSHNHGVYEEVYRHTTKEDLSWKCWQHVFMCHHDANNVCWNVADLTMSPMLWLDSWLGHMSADVQNATAHPDPWLLGPLLHWTSTVIS